MDCEFRLRDSDVLITDSVLDFSKYLTSSDLPASPEEFFDDLFVEEKTEKPLPCPVKIKEEPCYSSASSRCSTPESLLPEHDFENIDIPSPKFYGNECRQDSLVYQLQSGKTNVQQNEPLHHKLHQALTHFQDLQASPAPSGPRKAKSSQKASKRKSCDKSTDEYRMKRERNNIAVRKSRNKSKMKHIETEVRVSQLSDQNDQLRSKVVLLQRELAALRNFVALNAPALVAKAPGFFSSAVPNNIDNPSIYLNCTDKSKIINGRVERVC
ncbi:CCAAT/enhancer-binding protein delta-like [Rhopilema esculentum]|uniref:CCAAT/enhancer-binding protein delta-like n=1 Tax=Rhopilema esculentum TaxID=499914 RepID=UPI0031D5E3B7|eukprot:gene2587-782_t